MPPNTMPSLAPQGVEGAAIPQPTSSPVAPAGGGPSGAPAPTPPKSHHKMCEKCGKRLPSKAVACPACGAAVTVRAAPGAPGQYPPAPKGPSPADIKGVSDMLTVTLSILFAGLAKKWPVLALDGPRDAEVKDGKEVTPAYPGDARALGDAWATPLAPYLSGPDSAWTGAVIATCAVFGPKAVTAWEAYQARRKAEPAPQLPPVELTPEEIDLVMRARAERTGGKPPALKLDRDS